MAANLGDRNTTAEAAGLAVKIGSAAVESISCGDLGEELPLVQPVLKTLGSRRRVGAEESRRAFPGGTVAR